MRRPGRAPRRHPAEAGPGEGTAGAGPGAESVLDCRGQRCPQPVLELARHLRDLPAGTTVRVLADDPAARTDIPAWCRMRSQDYLGEGPGPSFLVRRRG